jgi:hypothetical protein
MSETSLNWKNSLDLPYECDHIVDRALARENAMVLMGCLMFLALSSGDAFALDLDDRLACALCLKGEKQPYPLLDNGDQWAFKWPWSYSVSRGRIHFERTDGGGPVDLRVAAGTIERQLKMCNQRAGTNYHL